MDQAFQKLFWGFLFILLDVNIIFFDILPDFIGYFIVLTGLNQLGIKRAKMIALILAIISIFALIQIDTFIFGEIFPGYASISFTTITSLLHLILVSDLLREMITLAEKSDFPILAEKSKRLLRYYVIGILFALTLTPFTLNMTEDSAIFIIIVIATISILVEIMLLLLLRQFRKNFNHNTTLES